ncbi:MAG: hypothetical protein RLZZ507_3496 [Cyanobacteriota bacterium]
MKLSRILPLVVGGAVAGMVVSGASPAQALVFNFQFDNTDDGTVTPPIVGTGTFVFDGDPGNGTFALTSLTNFDFSFTFGANTFTNANIATPVANVLVAITTAGSDRFVRFGGGGGGPLGGSIDFNNAGNFLTFQPNFGTLYGTTSNFGSFSGTASAAAVPFDTPAGQAMATFGSLFVLGLMRQAKKRLAAKKLVINPVETVV